MSDDSRYEVLVSTDGGVNWRRHAGIIGSSPDTAINRLRDAYKGENGDPNYTDPETLFIASANLRPRKMEKQLVERWALARVELPEEAGTDG